MVAAVAAFAIEDTDLAEDEPSSTCPLAGFEDGALTVFPPDGEGSNSNPDKFDVCLFNKKKRLTCLTVKGVINEAKLQIECRGDKIKIWTEQGFSAASSTYNLRYAKGKLLLARQEVSDPSRQAMESYDKSIKKGDVKNAVAALDGVLYPDHYYDAKDVCIELMTTAHKAVSVQLKSKMWSEVTAVIKPAWDWCMDVTIDPLTPKLKVRYGGMLLAMNDYGFALVESGSLKDGEAALARVVAIDKERVPAWLNLGDAQFGQKKDSSVAYGEYCKRVPKAKRPARVAARAKNCAN